MDVVSELIAAGESITKNYNNKLKSPVKNTSLCNTKLVYSSKDVDSGCFIADKECILAHEISSYNQADYNSRYKELNVQQNAHDPNSFHYENVCSSNVDTESCKDSDVTFSDLHLHQLKEECASIFSISHFMASSLLNANRLLEQTNKNNSKDSDSVATGDSLCSEISLCNESCKDAEYKLQAARKSIFLILGKLGENYYLGKELENIIGRIHDKIVCLLELTKDLLLRNKLEHLVADLNGNGWSAERLLEELSLRLTLLSGELPSLLVTEQTRELGEARKTRNKLEQNLKSLENEIHIQADAKNEKISNVEIQLEKTHKELQEAKEEIEFLQKQKTSEDENFQKQLLEFEKARTTLSFQLQETLEQKREIKSESQMEKVNHDRIIKNFDEKIESLKDKIKATDNQQLIFEKTIEKLHRELRETRNKSSLEVDGLKSKLLKAELELQNSAEKNTSLCLDVERQCQFAETLKQDIQTLLVSIEKRKQSSTSDLTDLEKKMDSKNEELCEKESKIRSLELNLMESQTELELERQRSCSLHSEIDLLHKQVTRLQEKIEKLIRFCPRDARIKSGMNLPVDDSIDSSQELQKLLDESHQREFDLKKLLNEKDQEMKNLTQNLSQELARKNRELEELSSSVGNLEEEMTHMTSSFAASSDHAHTLAHTSAYLDSRSKCLDSLQEQVRRLSITSSVPCDSNAELVASLKSELNEAKKSVRIAREEARKERIEAARLKQQLAMIQIDLESARERAKNYNCLVEKHYCTERKFDVPNKTDETK